MTSTQRAIKRGFDVVGAAAVLLIMSPVIPVCWVIASIDTGASGFFRQTRVGRHGRRFEVIKLRTMRDVAGTNVTTANDARITRWGAFFRRTKLDEVPQVWNVLVGDMSFVGPRPDVPGYLDRLEGDERALLSLRPGVTGPASLKYRDEEEILAQQENPEQYNDEVIWPDKVRINLDYLNNWSFLRDLFYIRKTFLR